MKYKGIIKTIDTINKQCIICTFKVFDVRLQESVTPFLVKKESAVEADCGKIFLCFFMMNKP